MLTNTSAKDTLKVKGWSYRRAAGRLSFHAVSIARILNHGKKDHWLFEAIDKLPVCRNVPKNSMMNKQKQEGV